MGEFQRYIMDESKDLSSKMDIVLRLQKFLNKKKGERIFFDKSVVFKTQIARMFIDYMHLDVNREEVLTACLLCNCKKVDNAQKIGKLHSYAKEGADYLLNIGFDFRFCRICEGVNRYSGLPKREPESDILELAENFGGMMLDRPERAGFSPEEALVQLECDNLKNVENRYLKLFHDFVNMMQEIELQMSLRNKEIGIQKKPFAILKTNVCDKAVDMEDMINRNSDFEKNLDYYMKMRAKEELNKVAGSSSRPLFTPKTVANALNGLRRNKEIENENKDLKK